MPSYTLKENLEPELDSRQKKALQYLDFGTSTIIMIDSAGLSELKIHAIMGMANTLAVATIRKQLDSETDPSRPKVLQAFIIF